MSRLDAQVKDLAILSLRKFNSRRTHPSKTFRMYLFDDNFGEFLITEQEAF